MSDCPLISVVDDDEGVRTSLDGLVRSLGYRVETFGSAEAFLDSDARNTCDCVISDVQMDGMSGMQLAQEVTPSGTPVILISAFADACAQAKAAAAGAHCLLKKPFDCEQLIGCIDSALEE
ncbi:response regulator transcription factor [Sphingoaurantiacus capsulatus]|uniref:Response regulator transcription factor n=1 Tax=Sphingoaurantiacus capsulatus TaxID=1771310 RepID=A0ABV7XCG3_9SPHN